MGRVLHQPLIPQLLLSMTCALFLSGLRFICVCLGYSPPTQAGRFKTSVVSSGTTGGDIGAVPTIVAPKVGVNRDAVRKPHFHSPLCLLRPLPRQRGVRTTPPSRSVTGARWAPQGEASHRQGAVGPEVE